MTVFKEYYEVTGADELAKARVFAAAQSAAWDAQWALVKELGGEGFRPGHAGGLKSVLFAKGKTRPEGWRKTGTDRGRDECVPALNTKAGKGLRTRMAAVARVEDWGQFANTFGWKGRSPMDGAKGMIYFCSGVRVVKPRERLFLTYPRVLKDGWTAPAGLTEVRESDMLRAIEDHNAAIKTKEAA